jgi:hypothetical protein
MEKVKSRKWPDCTPMDFRTTPIKVIERGETTLAQALGPFKKPESGFETNAYEMMEFGGPNSVPGGAFEGTGASAGAGSKRSAAVPCKRTKKHGDASNKPKTPTMDFKIRVIKVIERGRDYPCPVAWTVEEATLRIRDECCLMGGGVRCRGVPVPVMYKIGDVPQGKLTFADAMLLSQPAGDPI